MCNIFCCRIISSLRCRIRWYLQERAEKKRDKLIEINKPFLESLRSQQKIYSYHIWSDSHTLSVAFLEIPKGNICKGDENGLYKVDQDVKNDIFKNIKGISPKHISFRVWNDKKTAFAEVQ